MLFFQINKTTMINHLVIIRPSVVKPIEKVQLYLLPLVAKDCRLLSLYVRKVSIILHYN